MSKYTRKFVVLAVILTTVFALAFQGSMSRAAAPVTVNWFVGLGAGTQPEQLKPQQDVVDKFNASHPDIVLKLTIAASNQVAGTTLSTLLAAGKDVPDIVGPLGVEGTTLYHDSWLDIAPLIKKANYDLKAFADSQVKVNQEGDKMYGVPFGVYPGVLFFNKDLFDAAGLDYPPTKFGDQYKLDGKMVDWSWDTVYAIAKKLTFDKAGKDATDPAFDPTNIVQFGLDHQWDTERSDMQTYGGAPVIDPTTKKVLLTAAWRQQAKDMFTNIWVDHSMPNATYEASDLLKPSAFASGKVAMGRVMLWYTCCLSDLKAKWDIGIQPSYKGVYTAPSDVDTFRIYKGTKNPDAAFTVLSYLTNEADLDLLTIYGSVPARTALQDKFIETLKAKYPSVQNWGIIGPELDHAAVPHHQSDYPNYARGQNRFADFNTWLRSAGPDAKLADVDTQLDKLQKDLQTLVDNPSEALPTAAATSAK